MERSNQDYIEQQHNQQQVNMKYRSKQLFTGNILWNNILNLLSFPVYDSKAR